MASKVVRKKPASAARISNNDADGLRKVMAALAAQPARKVASSAVDRMVRAAAREAGFDYEKASAGEKSAFTKRVKLAMKASGIAT